MAAVLTASASASAYSWHEIPTPAYAYEIAAGDGTSPWIVGTTEDGTSGNYYLYYYNPSNGDWVKATGAGSGGVKIGVAYGNIDMSLWNYPLIINSAGNIFSGIPSANDIGNGTSTMAVTWTESSVSGACATTITSEGYKETDSYAIPWVTGCDSVSGGHNLYSNSNTSNGLDLNDWVEGPGTGEQMSVAQDGSIGIVYDSSNNIWISCYAMFDTWTYQEMPGSAQWVSAGAGTTAGLSDELALAWVVGMTNKLYYVYWTGSTWTWAEVSGGPSGSAVRVSVGWNGTVWALDSSNRIWYYN